MGGVRARLLLRVGGGVIWAGIGFPPSATVALCLDGVADHAFGDVACRLLCGGVDHSTRDMFRKPTLANTHKIRVSVGQPQANLSQGEDDEQGMWRDLGHGVRTAGVRSLRPGGGVRVPRGVRAPVQRAVVVSICVVVVCAAILELSEVLHQWRSELTPPVAATDQAAAGVSV